MYNKQKNLLILIDNYSKFNFTERSDLEALLTETRSIKDDPIRKPSEVKIDSDNYFGESTQVGVNVTSFNETKTSKFYFCLFIYFLLLMELFTTYPILLFD